MSPAPCGGKMKPVVAAHLQSNQKTVLTASAAVTPVDVLAGASVSFPGPTPC